MQRKTALSCLLIAVLGTLSYGASAAPSYTITPIGSPSNGLGANMGSAAYGGLNNNGQVVGTFFDNNQVARAYLYSNGTTRSIDPPGSSTSRASGINDAGTVVATVTHGNDDRATVIQNGRATDLGTLGGSNSYGDGINNAGTVVGASYLAGETTFHAFTSQNGKMSDIGTLIGASGYSEAYAINDVGMVVGYSETSDGGYHAFSYLNGTMSDLGALGGLYSQANAVNDSGTIVGYAYGSGGFLTAHGFLYANGTMMDLGTMGATESFAYDLNGAGDVVGQLETDNADGSESDRAFLYSGGQMIDLNSLIDPASGWILTSANAINDNGQIAARGCRADGSCDDLLLNRVAEVSDPVSNVPEPEAFTAGIAGLALFGLLRRRRSAR